MKKTPKKMDVFSFGSPCWTRTNDPAVNSRMLYRLSYGGIYSVGNYLSSQAVASQVFSALMSLTTVFGMGTGGPSSLSLPTFLYYNISYAKTQVDMYKS